MSKRASYSERFHYFVDNLLVRGNVALFLSLIIVLFGAIVFIAILRLVTEMFLPDGLGNFHCKYAVLSQENITRERIFRTENLVGATDGRLSVFATVFN